MSPRFSHSLLWRVTWRYQAAVPSTATPILGKTHTRGEVRSPAHLHDSLFLVLVSSAWLPALLNFRFLEEMREK